MIGGQEGNGLDIAAVVCLGYPLKVRYVSSPLHSSSLDSTQSFNLSFLDQVSSAKVDSKSLVHRHLRIERAYRARRLVGRFGQDPTVSRLVLRPGIDPYLPIPLLRRTINA
jgi:hypothetical protein